MDPEPAMTTAGAAKSPHPRQKLPDAVVFADAVNVTGAGVETTGATFKGYSVPPGTVVSMSAWSMHHNTELFTDPDKFGPTRWTDPDVDAVHARERSLVVFGRGARNCLGQNLAMCELYYSVASIIRRWDDLKVHPDFGREDMKLVEFLSAYHPKKARKLRLVRG